jgi:hypothetical protein
MTRIGLLLIVVCAVLAYGGVALLIAYPELALTAAGLAIVIGVALALPFMRTPEIGDVHYPAAPDAGPDDEPRAMRAKGGR